VPLPGKCEHDSVVYRLAGQGLKSSNRKYKTPVGSSETGYANVFLGWGPDQGRLALNAEG